MNLGGGGIKYGPRVWSVFKSPGKIGLKKPTAASIGVVLVLFLCYIFCKNSAVILIRKTTVCYFDEIFR